MSAFLPELTFAFEARVHVAEAIRIGRAAGHEPWFAPITGGTVAGPMLTGEVLPHGGDWYVEGPASTTLDARYLLRADDGTVIGITNRGFYRTDPDVEARLQAGGTVDEREYYYRTSAVFETDAPGYEWLTGAVFVGLARADGGDVCIRFFRLG